MEDGPGAVGGSVVNDNDFVRHAAEIQLQVQMLQGGCDASFFIASGNDDRQEAHKNRAETETDGWRWVAAATKLEFEP